VSWEEIKPLSEVYDAALEAISWRYGIPACRFWERILPYGSRLRANIAQIRQGAAELVEQTKEKMREEELGLRELDPEKGLLIRSLLKEDLDDKTMVDALVTFANAGQSDLISGARGADV
jgi:hypothetical protein